MLTFLIIATLGIFACGALAGMAIAVFIMGTNRQECRYPPRYRVEYKACTRGVYDERRSSSTDVVSG